MNTDRHSMLRPHAQNRPAIILLGLLTAGWIALLFIESSGPSAAIIGEVYGLDKIAHFFAFGTLGLLFYALISQLGAKDSLSLILPLLLTALVGGLEEGYQMFVPGRTSSLADLLADVCGALFAILLANRIALYLLGGNRAADASKI